MALIESREAELLREHFARTLDGPVRIDLYVEPERLYFRASDDCEYCGQTKELMEELCALSDKLELRVHVLSQEPEEAGRLGISQLPTMLLSGAARGSLRFTGLPLGNELTGLLEALVAVSAGRTGLDEQARKALAGLERDVSLKLFVSPSCPYCPAVARLVQQLAIESSRVTAELIDADEFPELVERHGVLGVPTLLVNGEIALAGMQPEPMLLGALSRAAGRR